MQQLLKIGVSACLMGQEVRFNGGHCNNRYLSQILSKYATFHPVCPEVAIGMGTPRKAVRLERDHPDGSVRMVEPQSGQDFTEKMNAFAAHAADGLEDLDGFVFKKNSPSCGVFRVKVYQNDQPSERRGTGLFAKAVMEKYPNLPVEEDGRLADPVLREHFLVRVFAYRRVKELFGTDWKRKDIIAFQATEKMLLMAHNPHKAKELGRLVAQMKKYKRDDFSKAYIDLFMTCMNSRPNRGRHVNALSHMAGYLRGNVGHDGRGELRTLIEDYKTGLVPMVVPMTLLNHMVRRADVSYLAQQSYLSPAPWDLALRNHT